MIHLVTPSGKRLPAEITTDWGTGMSCYDLPGVGAFTLTPDAGEGDRLEVAYGRPSSPQASPDGIVGWTGHPVVRGVALAGRARVRLAEMERLIAAHPNWKFGWHVWMERPARLRPLASRDFWAATTVTDQVNLDAAQVVAAIARHHAARPDRSALIRARAAAVAPARIAELEARRKDVVRRILDAQAEAGRLDVEVANWAALLPAAPRTPVGV
ncbi:hypothetical protein ACFY4B_26920 [Kitasatospora sp. NPDC001261]|uniref:hypothetical protein n=1 Tax=Kitasatospora sp. NPDC001261 TaxID=3364012 RepID=UPI0036B32543